MTNRDAALRSIDAVNRLALDDLVALATDDVVFDMSRSIGPAQGVYHGVEGVRRFLDSYLDAFGSVVGTPLDFYERGDWMAVEMRVHVRGRSSGVEVDVHGARVYEFRNGKIARYVQFQTMDDARQYVDSQP